MFPPGVISRTSIVKGLAEVMNWPPEFGDGLLTEYTEVEQLVSPCRVWLPVLVIDYNCHHRVCFLAALLPVHEP